MEKKQPYISVIIPAFNAENYICQAVQSVLDQTYEGTVEILVVDDASEDGTEKAVLTLAPKAREGAFLTENRYLRYLKKTENQGVAGARNDGVQNAGGEYIAFLDADDWWAPEKLEKQIRQMRQGKEELGFCFTGRELMDRQGNSLEKKIPVPEKVDFHDMLRTNYVPCSSVLMKRDLALAHPMEHDEYCEDYICWMRILKEGGFAVGINEPLLKYRMLKGSKSNNKMKAASDHYHSLRILGISPVRAGFYMISYAYNGMKKYS